MARPTKYKEELNNQVYKLALLGLTDKEISKFLEISESTLNYWKIEHPLFLESLNKGKEEADAKVVEALYKRALGYRYKEVKDDGQNIIETEKEVVPDATSCIYWLNNRTRHQEKSWSNKQSIELSNAGDEDFTFKMVAPNADTSKT